MQQNFIQSHQRCSELSKSSEDDDKDKNDYYDRNNDYIKWNSSDLRFFNFTYDEKTVNSDNSVMKHAEKNEYFRNIYLFIIKAKKMIVIKSAQLIQNNLWLSLRDITLKWYTDELFNNKCYIIRIIIFNSNDEFTKWIILLLKYFRKSNNIIL